MTEATPPLEIDAGDPRSPDAQALIQQLDAYLETLYPPEENYLEPPESLAEGIFLIARYQGTAVGCVAVKPLPSGDGEIKRLYVSPKVRGLGVARQLMHRVEQDARSEGIRALLLETGAKQVQACRLYETIGYQICGPFGDYPDNGASLFMQKRL